MCPPQEPSVDVWRVPWITLHYIDEDLRKFEEAERETQERLQVTCLEEGEVDQLQKDRETTGESLAFLKKNSDNTVVELCETPETRDESTCTQRLKDQQGKKSERISHVLRRSASEETTRCYVEEGIIVEDVEERIFGAAAVDLEWRFRCHFCSGPERTYKYFEFFIAKFKEEDEEYTRDVCKKCLLKTEGGQVSWSHQALEVHQQQRRTGGTMEISRGLHGITFEVVRTFQQELIRANMVMAQASDTLVREVSGVTDAKEQEDLDMLHRNETIPYVSIVNIKKAIKGAAGRILVGSGRI